MKINNFVKELATAWRYSQNANKDKLPLFLDIMSYYRKYHVKATFYIDNEFELKTKEEKDKLAADFLKQQKSKQEWSKDFYENRKFLSKWTKFEVGNTPSERRARAEAYRKRYNMGEGCTLEHDVCIERHHFLFGSIEIGNHVTLSKHVLIDYTGFVKIEDDVKITNGVIIESHHRDLDAFEKGEDVNIQDTIRICEGAYIGSRAIILPSCHYIGKYARIGAGAVVTKDVPDYALVGGVPAKIIRITNSDNNNN